MVKPKRPLELKYTESHEWVRLQDKTATVGITDFAVSQLSDLVHLELPEEGEELEQDSPFGEIESVKTVADLISPAGGKIAAVNEAVAKNLDILHEDPYEEGWLVKIKINDPKELEDLMTAKEYETFLLGLNEPADDDKDAAEEEEDEEEEDVDAKDKGVAGADNTEEDEEEEEEEES